MNLTVSDKSQLKDLMLRNKNFLAKLYTSQSPSISKKIIVNGETSELNVLIQVLHYICAGKLPVKKQDFDCIVQKRKHGVLYRSFRTLEATNKLLNASREVQCQVLTKINGCYKFLFYFLFNED